MVTEWTALTSYSQKRTKSISSTSLNVCPRSSDRRVFLVAGCQSGMAAHVGREVGGDFAYLRAGTT